MSVNPAQDQVQPEAPVQDPAAATPTAPANVDAAPNNQSALMFNVMGALLRGEKITAEDIPSANLGPLNDIVGAFIDESQIGGYIEQNHETVREMIMGKLTDPSIEPANNILVKIITGMPAQQFGELLEDNPQLKQIVSDIIEEQTSPDNLTVASVLEQLQIAPEGFESIVDLKVTELTPASLKDISSENLLSIAATLPYTPEISQENPEAPQAENVETKPTGFNLVIEGFNVKLEEAGLQALEVPENATSEQKLDLLNGAITDMAQARYDNSTVFERQWLIMKEESLTRSSSPEEFVEFYRNKGIGLAGDQIREQAPAAINALVGDYNPEAIDAATIQGFVKNNPDMVVAALQKPENQQKLKNALTTDFLVNNAALMKPYAGEFMQGNISNMLAGLVNELSDHPIFGELIESMQGMFAQFTDKLGVGNMFAGLGIGGGQPAQSSMRNQYGEAVDPSTSQTANRNAPIVETANIDGPPEYARHAMPASP